ncbi:sensor histidine kinase [Lactococcus petauri]|uniref:sensor histidine kinase n=1 Tax=Lactococcus petauri TaxID=1940789 RepID=UPI0022E622FE|nr:HAMP domain-containing sensor histidine kinase [Lactococcus petauri]
MATKWKNKFAVSIGLALLLLGVNSLVFTALNAEQYIFNDYFQSKYFKQEVATLEEALINTQVNPNLPIKVTAEDIEEYRMSQPDKYSQVSVIKEDPVFLERLKDAKAAGDKTAIKKLEDQQNKKLNEVEKFFTDDKYVTEKVKEQKKELIAQQKTDWMPQYKELSSDIHYQVTEINSGKYLDNLSDNKTFATAKTLFKGNISQINFDGQNRFDGQIIILKNSNFNQRASVKSFTEMKNLTIGLLCMSILSFAAFLVYWKKTEKGEDILLEKVQSWDKIALDGQIFLALILFLLYLSLTREASLTWSFLPLLQKFCWAFLVLYLFAIVSWGIYHKAQERENWQQTYLARSIRLLKDAADNFSTGSKAWFIFWSMGAAVVGFLLAMMWGGQGIILYLFVLVIYLLLISIYLLRRLVMFNQTVKIIEEIAQGKNAEVLNVKPKGKTVFRKVSENLKTINEEVKTSKSQQVKSERLKTELITNVSHDLRTPLTSIITSVDLLRNADLSQEEKNKYVAVIDQKSKRLKVLIDDLFEVSKMASGNIDLKKSIIDLVQLLDQSLAELSEKIEDSSLKFVTQTDKELLALVDGDKMWRVFENLIHNILKYSMENTRVYISGHKSENGTIELVFKNISREELGENSQELSQRFKRGDLSRNTTGSGLGLAIAQSIVEAHEGRFLLETDGDLFKVTLSFPSLELE